MTRSERRSPWCALGLVVTVLVMGTICGEAQTALRLRGQALAASGSGVPASIELEAV